MAGASLGHFLSPLLIRLLQDKYGFRGATIIIGAIVLHGFVGAMFFQPVRWHMKRPKKRKCSTVSEPFSPLLSQSHNHGNRVCELVTVTVPDTKQGDTNWESVENERHFQGVSSNKRDDSSHMSVKPKRTSVYSQVKPSMLSCLGPESKLSFPHSIDSGIPPKQENKQRNRRNYLCKLCHTIFRVFCSVVKDIRILRQPSSLIIALWSTLILNGEANFMVMVPFAIQAGGHSLQTAAWCVSVAGITNFLTRMCVSTLSDLPCFNMRLCYMTGMAIMSVSVVGK